MELKKYIELILKYRWVIIQSIVIITLTVIIGTFFQKPVYQAGIKILVQQSASNLGVLSDLARMSALSGVSQASNPINTQIELIKTRPVIEEVVHRLNLKLPNGAPVAYESIVSKISISPVRLADLVQIYVESTDPKEAADIANTLGNVYVEQNQKMNQEEARKAKEFIEDQINKTGGELSVSESTLGKQINISRLTRSTKVAEQIYIDLLRKLGEAKISEAMKIGNVRVVEPATAPKNPIKPNKGRSVLLALIFSSMVGLGLAFLFEYLDDAVPSADELKDILKLPVLGMVYKIENIENKRKQNNKWLQKVRRFGQRFNIKILSEIPESGKQLNKMDELIVLDKPRSPAAESFRIIRTNIQFVNPDEQIKSIGISSSGPFEGKTVFISNLAIIMAQAGKKVLLVDSDLRKPRIHKIFNLANNAGLTNYLARDATSFDIINKSKIENLCIITSGPIPPNPAELIGSKKMLSFIAEQTELFDLVLFDCPPILSVTDPSLLGSKIGGVLLVVDSVSASRQMVIRAKQLLQSAQVNILGVVLQKVGLESAGYYYNRYYNYYYHEEEHAAEKVKI